MKKYFLLLFLSTSFCTSQHTGKRKAGFRLEQSRSHLPVVVVQTDKTIVNNKKTAGYLGLYEKNTLLTEDARGLRLPMEIEIRGHTSAGYPKKQYSVKLVHAEKKAAKTSLLGMAESDNWILQGPYGDRSLMRNYLAYALSAKMGQYSVKSQFVEVYLQLGTSMAEYNGVYVLMERIGRDEGRLAVGKLREEPMTKPSEIGGFIVKIDKIDEGDLVLAKFGKSGLIPVYPKSKKMSNQQMRNLESYFTQVKAAIASGEISQINALIDVPSFIDFALLREFSADVDSYWASTFFHKFEQGLLKAGPVWDFDIAFGNHSKRTGSTHFRPKRRYWWNPLLKHPEVAAAMKKRWQDLRKTVFSDASMTSLVDETAQHLGPAQQRNFEKWKILGRTDVWPKREVVPKDYAGELTYLKEWLVERAKWFDGFID